MSLARPLQYAVLKLQRLCNIANLPAWKGVTFKRRFILLPMLDSSHVRHGACRNINRFQHYQQRWEGQRASQQMENVLRAKVDVAIKELELSTASHVDHAWLPQVCLFTACPK